MRSRNTFILDPVHYEPELHLTGKSVVSINDDIRLVCNATGATTAPDSVDWFFNGQPVAANPQWHDRLVRINDKPVPGRSLISELIIKHATMEDHVHFLCRLTKTLTQSVKVHILNGICAINYLLVGWTFFVDNIKCILYYLILVV